MPESLHGLPQRAGAGRRISKRVLAVAIVRRACLGQGRELGCNEGDLDYTSDTSEHERVSEDRVDLHNDI